MKKKIIALNLVLCLGLLCVCLTGCFSSGEEKLVVTYTPNIQFFVGEDWHDDLITGTYYSDDTEKDVTEDLNIDTSAYNKNEVGNYDISFEYSGIKVKYQVSVVETMTDSRSIKNHIEPCFQKAFKEQNGVLEFSATCSEDYIDGVYLKQTIEYKLDNGNLKEYYKIELTDGDTESTSLCEMLYVGDLTNGILTTKYYTTDDEEPTDDSVWYYAVNSKSGTWSEFETTIQQIATAYEVEYLDASQFLNFYTNYYPLLVPSTLTKDANTYTIKLNDNSIIKIDNEGFMSEFCGIELSKTTTIPSELTAA